MKKNSLKDKRIVLTRKDNEPLASELTNLGADVLEIPLIDIKLKADPEIAEDVLSNIATYQWLIFSSANGVRGFFKEFFRKYSDIRSIGPCRIAAVGVATAQELKNFYIQTDVVPKTATGEAMAKAVMEFETLENLMVLNISGNLQDGSIVKILQEEGHAIVDTFPVYETTLLDLSPKDKAVKDFSENGADAILFASASAVQSFMKNIKAIAFKDGARHPKAYSIGPKTSEEMKKLGIAVAAEASNPNEVLEMFEDSLH